MAAKENKGGVLTNEQVEQDLKAKGKSTEGSDAYTGSQDTGEKKVRQAGNDGQQADSRSANTSNGER